MGEDDLELPVAKRRKYSKNKKKNWRKHSNVKDVDEFLEERRREERTGGVAAEKCDDELFFEQKDPEDQTIVPMLVESRNRKKKLPLRSEANLYPDTNVPPISTPCLKKKRIKVHATNYEDSSEDEYDSRSCKETLKHKLRLKAAVIKRKMKKVKKEIGERGMRDLWSESANDHKTNDEFYMKVTRKQPIKKPVTLAKKPSAVSHVEPPHPGASYNPAYVDHQRLLNKANEIEERQLAAEQALDKRLQLAELDHHERKRIWVEEMSEGLPKPLHQCDNEQQEEEECDDAPNNDTVHFTRPIRAEDRKTRKQRRKEREIREAEKLRKSLKQDRVNMEEVYRLKSIKKDLNRQEELSRQKSMYKMEKRKQEAWKTKRLGKHPYEKPILELNLSNEITGSLRTLKPEGSLASDRFKSLQRRNMIVPKGPRAPPNVRRRNRAKVKVVERRSAKVDC